MLKFHDFGDLTGCISHLSLIIILKKIPALIHFEKPLADFLHNSYSKSVLNEIKYACEICLSEVVVRRCSVKKVFLEISKNSQKYTCARASLLIKFQALGMNLGLKTRVFFFQIYNLESCFLSETYVILQQ